MTEPRELLWDGKHRAFLFDLDGVLTDTATVHARAWKETFDAFLAAERKRHEQSASGTRAEDLARRFRPFDLESDYDAYVDGRPRDEGAAAFLASRNIDLPLGEPSDPPGWHTISAIGNQKDRAFLALLARSGVKVFADARALLLTAIVLGRQVAVVSSSENTRHVLEAAGLSRWFPVVVDGILAKARGLAGKPSPDAYLEAARLLLASPEDAVVFEDAASGVAAGRAGGFGLVVGIARHGQADALARAGADVVVEDMGSLAPGWHLPPLDMDPSWCVVVDGNSPGGCRVHETLLSLADGCFGTRGTLEEDGLDARPAVLASGIYAMGPNGVPELVNCPNWVLGCSFGQPAEAVEASSRRVLDLRRGLLHRFDQDGHQQSVRFACIARPGVAVLRAQAPPGRLKVGPPLALPGQAPSTEGESTTSDPSDLVLDVTAPPGGVVVAARQSMTTSDSDSRMERIAAYVARSDAPPEPAQARSVLAEAASVGFLGLLAEQTTAFKERWAAAAVSVDGDPEVELALRFGIFHLLTSVADEGESAVGARGLSGPGYGGHVFWDADVFVLPVMAALHPPAARAMIRYRCKRLDAAREAAREAGREGARFPWESTDTGVDVTPRTARAPDGSVVEILTGELEEHITADVAWAAAFYASWSGDTPFATGPGRELILEAARYWASRLEADPDGTMHIRNVIGPDEYHVHVDDNAYTNVMARWNLRAAAGLLHESDPETAAAWRSAADRIVDNYDPVTGLYEQFAGYYGLEPLLVASIAKPPVAADVLLGPERVAGSQVIKQSDVLMLHHLVPDEVAPGSLEPNLDFYAPRTAHGSSLSPAIHAALLARAGRLEEALEFLRLASRVDLDDIGDTTAAGLHLAAMGGAWQAVAFGFAGLSARKGVLCVDPRLPDSWKALELRCIFQGRRVRLLLDHNTIEIRTDQALRAQPGPGAEVVSVDKALRFVRKGEGWVARGAS